MIDRYTIKFGPAVSQKELEKALNGPSFNDFEECDDCRKKPGSPQLCADCLRRRAEFEKTIGKPQQVPHLNKLRARIEFIGDFTDIKKLKEILIQLSNGPQRDS